MVGILPIPNSILNVGGVHLDVVVSSKEEAITRCATYLEDMGATTAQYLGGMLEREGIISSYLGKKVAIPHGTDPARAFVNFGQLIFMRLKEEILWDEEPVALVIAIAAKGEEQVDVLGNLAECILDDGAYKILMQSPDVQEILAVINDRKGLGS